MRQNLTVQLKQKVVSISSVSDKELDNAAAAPDTTIPPLKCSGSSSQPTVALRLACDPKSLGIGQYEGRTIISGKAKICLNDFMGKFMKKC